MVYNQDYVDSPIDNSAQTGVIDYRFDDSGPSNKKLWIVTGTLVVLLLAVLGGVFYYINYVAPSPEAIFVKGLNNLKNLKSGTINYESVIDFKSKNKVESDALSMSLLAGLINENFSFKVVSKNDFNIEKDFISIVSDTVIDIPVGAEVPLVGQLNVSPSLSIIQADKDSIYLKIKGLPKIYFLDFTAINDRWLKFSSDESESDSGISISTSSYKSTSDEVAEWRDKIINTYKKNNFLILTRLKDEVVDNENCYHLEMALDKEKFKGFSLEMSKEAKQEGITTASTTDLYMKRLDDQLKAIAFSGEVWIGKKSSVFKKITIKTESFSEAGDTTVNQSLVLANYNKPININVPSEAMTFEEAVEVVMSGAASFEDDVSTSTSVGGDTTKEADKILNDIDYIKSTLLKVRVGDSQKLPFPPIGGGSFRL